jgi:hypothetical protein
MSLYVRAFLLALLASSVAVLPFLLFHGISILGSLGIILAFAAVGPVVSLRDMSRSSFTAERKEEWTLVGALFLPVLALLLQAAIWSFVHFSEEKTVVPRAISHWAAIVAGIGAFALWVAYSSHLYRVRQKPNKAPEPTTGAVTTRAPSSTARASHGRGSS